MEDKNLLDKLKDKARATAEGLKRQYGIGEGGTPWPQVKSSPLELYPNANRIGFLHPTHIPIIIKDNVIKLDSLAKQGEYTYQDWTGFKYRITGNTWPHTYTTGSNSNGYLNPLDIPIDISNKIKGSTTEIKKGSYIYKDWTGHLLDPKRELNKTKKLSTNDRFNLKTNFKKKDVNNEELDIPYSTRESYLLFDDNRTDYFRHGLQIIDNLNNLLQEGDNPINSRTRLESFKSTPFEQNDPVIFGFDIIFDVANSPLLNGDINVFLSNYSNIGEVASRIPIYENFRKQFIKFFKTNSTVNITGNSSLDITINPNFSTENTSEEIRGEMGKRAYLSYYLNKVEGLEKLVEQNSAEKKKFLTEYNKDLIKLSFNEDVSLSLGTLSHLYKLLYWSKPNGKSIIPENLLRFNCDIVVSELRNYNRVIKALDTNEIQVIKDNASRYIYSLYDCQFYFSSMPHDSNIDVGGASSPSPYDRYSIEFDYKYSTLNFERFVPFTNGLGKYVGINNGAMWRINTGNRTDQENPVLSTEDSKPRIFTSFENRFGQNGVDINKELILSRPQNKTNNKNLENLENRTFDILKERDKDIKEIAKNKVREGIIERNNANQSNSLDSFKKNATNAGLQAKSRIEDRMIQSITREAQFQVNKATALLNKTLNKVISANLQKSIRPPRNIYTEGRFNPQDFNSLSGAGARIFYDVRGELFNFLGDVGGIIGNRNRSF